MDRIFEDIMRMGAQATGNQSLSRFDFAAFIRQNLLDGMSECTDS